MFVSTDILTHFNLNWNMMMKTDTLNYILIKCLFQKDSNSKLIKSVTFYSQKLIKSEQN